MELITHEQASDLLKRLQTIHEGHKIIIFNFDKKHPLYFIEDDGSVYKVEGSCVGCPTLCCDLQPALHPEFDDGKGHCKHFKAETQNDKPFNKCMIHSNKPFGCAMFPCFAPHLISEDNRQWIAEKCQFKLTKIAE